MTGEFTGDFDVSVVCLFFCGWSVVSIVHALSASVCTVLSCFVLLFLVMNARVEVPISHEQGSGRQEKENALLSLM